MITMPYHGNRQIGRNPFKKLFAYWDKWPYPYRVAVKRPLPDKIDVFYVWLKDLETFTFVRQTFKYRWEGQQLKSSSLLKCSEKWTHSCANLITIEIDLKPLWSPLSRYTLMASFKSHCQGQQESHTELYMHRYRFSILGMQSMWYIVEIEYQNQI